MTSFIMKWLMRAYLQREYELKVKFDRSLSFQDAMFDRWERADRLGFATGASIYNSALVYGDVEVGADTWIGPNTLLDGGGGGISIGSSCAISAGTQIYTHHNVNRFLSGGRFPAYKGPVKIGDNCFVSSQTIIDPNVEIGDCCLVAANSFVNRSFGSHAIIAGTPAKLIGRVEVLDDNVMLHYQRHSNDKEL